MGALSSFFAPFAARRAHFYNFAARNTPKVQIVFAPCRNIAVYTKRRANRVFHLLKTLWKSALRWAFPPFPPSFQQSQWRNFPHNSPDKPGCQPGITLIFKAKPLVFLTKFTKTAQNPCVLSGCDKSTSSTAKKPVDFLSKSGYNRLDGAPDIGTSLLITFYVVQHQ